MVRYISTYTKGTLKKRSARDLSNDVFFSDFVIKSMLWVLIGIASTSRCNSNGHLQHMPL